MSYFTAAEAAKKAKKRNNSTNSFSLRNKNNLINTNCNYQTSGRSYIVQSASYLETPLSSTLSVENKNSLVNIRAMLKRERVSFPVGSQAAFLKEAKRISGKKWRELDSFFLIPYNTIQTYFKENNRISAEDFTKICKKTMLKENETLSKYGAKKILWAPEEAFKGAVYLGMNRTTLRESNITFQTKELELNSQSVNFSNRDTEKSIKLPEKITPELAEETGMNLGDGFLSNKRFEYRLKGNKNDEKEYYKNVVKPLFKELYNANISIKEYETTVGFELSSKAIWEFKTKIVGIQPGRKTDIRIPEIFKVRNQQILCALLRGYFDTDGNIYFRSQGKNKKYYPVISAVSSSKVLIKDISQIFQMLGFEAKTYERNNISEVKLNGYKNFELYNIIIGTKQSKNIKKINEWRNKYPKIAERFMAAVV